MANAPTSYKDPFYDQLDSQTESQLGLPSGLLTAIRTKGERSNADAVSSAGAKSVYQIIPSTRAAALKKYGVDAYLSPENASQVAGLLLKESLDRNKGDVSQAVGEYVGGTNRANWGKTTNAYINRVTGSSVDSDNTSNSGAMSDAQIVAAAKKYKAGLQSQQSPVADAATGTLGAVTGSEAAQAAPVNAQATATGAMSDKDIVAAAKAWKAQGGAPAVVATAAPGQVQQQQPQTDDGSFLGDLGRQAGLTARYALQGAANTAGIAYDPLAAIQNALLGTKTPRLSDQATALANSLGLPTPRTDTERLVQAGSEALAGAGGFVKGGQVLAKAAQAAEAPIAAAIGRGAALNPTQQAIASGGGGLAGEQVRQEGGGPVAQVAANIGAALVAPARFDNAVRAANAIQNITKPLPKATAEDMARILENTPKETVLTPNGTVTDAGREMAIRLKIAPDDIKAIYGELEPATAAAAVREGQAPAVGARMAEAQALRIPLTKGQATQDFATQEAEQSLKHLASGEGEQARQFYQGQQDKIQQAVDNYREAFGNVELSAADRGQQLKDALRDMRDQGQAGVRRMYKAAADVEGEAAALDNDSILNAADEVILNRPVDEGVRTSIERAMAKFGLIGDNVEKAGRYNNVVTNDGSKIRILGDVEPLTLQNSEKLRQQLNQIYAADKTGTTSMIIGALDDAVEGALSMGASTVRAEAYQAARAAARTQKQTFAAKDIVNRLIDFKKGTKTDVVLPERAFTTFFSGPPTNISDLKKVKNLLLSKPTEESLQAWNAIKGQGIAHIFESAVSPSGDISGLRLNTALKKLGDDRLSTLLDPKELSELRRLQRVIGIATIPISGTTNPSGSGYKLINFMTRSANKMGHGIGDIGLNLLNKAKEVAKTRETLKGTTQYQGETLLANQKRAERANKSLIDAFIREAGSNKFIPYGLQGNTETEKRKF